jgi:predicted dehydrogenase
VIRLALAGLQHQHVEYAVAATARRDVRLVGLAEPEEAPRLRYAERLGVPAYRDHGELLDAQHPDVVAVFAAYADRAAVAVDSLDSGAHVLADKPLCTTVAQLRSVEAAWRRNDRVLSVLFEKRAAGVTRALAGVLAGGDLGELALVVSTGPHLLRESTRPPWFWDPARYGGVLNDLAVHDLDLLLWLSSMSAATVTARAGNRGVPQHPGFQDHGAILVAADDGPLATVDVHWLSPGAAADAGDYRMRVTGSRGTAELSWTYPRLVVSTHERAGVEPPVMASVPPAEPFFDALADGVAPPGSGAAALDATALALAAQCSADAGGVPVRWTATHRPRRGHSRHGDSG